MLFFDIVAEGQTEVTETIADELEFLKNNYDDIKVVEQVGFYPKVLLALDSETQPRRRITLEVSIVGGYPFVAPKVRIYFPEGVTTESVDSFTMEEVKELQNDVREAISPCLLVGAPCIMQIIAVVKKVLAGSPRRSRSLSLNKTNNSVDKLSSAPSNVKMQDVLRLCVFLYHILHKICHLKDPDSKEEAACNFESLAHYLCNELNIVPQKLQKSIPWKYAYVQRAFRANIREAMDGTDELRKWLWGDEEGAGKFQHSSSGRYKNEFIQQRMLGSGGFAPVYVCRKKVDGRLYAVKKIVLKASQSARILREVQSLAALSHKHIVRYYDAWIEPGCDEELLDFVENSLTEGTDISSDVMFPAQARNFTSTNNSCSSNETDRISIKDVSSGDESSSYGSTDKEFLPDLLSTPYVSHPEEYQTLYIQMELCSKQTLRHIIEKWDKGDDGNFALGCAEEMAATILRQLLTVVNHLHKETIVHRDLKPDNILFEIETSSGGTAIGTIRVADFGLARTLKPSLKREASSSVMEDTLKTATMSLAEQDSAPTGDLGSVLYCAPEQARGEWYSFKVDEYSIGMIALEMWLAIAGKGFRERFNIMTDVSRGGLLPEWFISWNPRMAGIIKSLVERNSAARRTCEDILNTGTLPGDPSDIVDALETIERHGKRVAGRFLHCIQQVSMMNYQESKVMLRENVKSLISTTTLALMQSINVIGFLHAAVFVPCYDFLVPMNPSLNLPHVPRVLDLSAGVWALPLQPQLAIAWFFSLINISPFETYYQFYYRTRPYVVFTTFLESWKTIDETLLDPVLSFIHLLSVIDSSSKVDIIISHAHWLNAIDLNETDSGFFFETLMHLRTPIESADIIAASVSRIDKELGDRGLLESQSERCDLVRKFTSALLEVLLLFEKQNASIGLFMDPFLKPAETSVNRSFLQNGLFFECRTREENRPIAFYCGLDNFTSRCNVSPSDAPVVSLSIDLFELGDISRRVSLPQNPPLVMDGVAIRQAVYSPWQYGSAIQAAVELWGDNVRACLRLDRGVDHFCKAMALKKIKKVVVCGNGKFSSAVIQQGRINVKADNISLLELQTFLRKQATDEKTGGLHTGPEVMFLDNIDETYYSQEAKKHYYTMIQSHPFRILVVDSCEKNVKKTLDEISSDKPPKSFKIPKLKTWIEENMADDEILFIFSTSDKLLSIFKQKEGYIKKGRKARGRRKR